MKLRFLQGRLPGSVLILALAALGCGDGEQTHRGERLGQDRIEAEERAEARAADDVPTEVRIARAAASDAALEAERIDWSGGNAERGRVHYEQFCAPCHGATGRGDGLAAAALNPKPRDFTSDAFYYDANANNETGEPVDLARVIREGPEAFGGSRAMPAWKDTFNETQLRDLVAYVSSL